MGIPTSIQVVYSHDVPLKLVRDKKGRAFEVTEDASVPVLLAAEGGDTLSIFVEGAGDVWFLICSSIDGRADYACDPVPAGEKETFELPALPNLGDKNYISLISRIDTLCTVNTYPRGT